MSLINIYFRKSFCDYLKIFALTFIGFILVIFLFDILEISRIASKYSANFSVLIKLSLMKNYSSLSQTIPMIILVSSLIYFDLKNKNNELIAAKSIGISNFKIVLPVILAVFLFGVCNITIINPVGTMLLKKYQNYEAHNFKKQTSLVSLSKSGIWLKNKLDNENLIINALRVSQLSNTMNDVKIFFINQNGGLERQIFAKSILFRNDDIVIKEAVIFDKHFFIKKEREMILPIKISISQIFENLATIDTISFFQLIEFIHITEESGLSSTRYLLHFIKELLSPLYIISMSMISFVFGSRSTNRKKFNLSSLHCLAVGFIIFFGTNFIHAIGLSGNISIILAVLFPVIVSNILALYLILYKN